MNKLLLRVEEKLGRQILSRIVGWVPHPASSILEQLIINPPYLALDAFDNQHNL